MAFAARFLAGTVLRAVFLATLLSHALAVAAGRLLVTLRRLPPSLAAARRPGQRPPSFCRRRADSGQAPGVADPGAVAPRMEPVDRPPGSIARAWTACRPTIGTLLIAIGLLCTVVPILPGTPVLLAGMAIAGSSHPVVRFVRRQWQRWRDAVVRSGRTLRKSGPG